MYEGIKYDMLDESEVFGPDRLEIFDKYGIKNTGTDFAKLTSTSFEDPSYFLKTPCKGSVLLKSTSPKGTKEKRVSEKVYLSCVYDEKIIDKFFIDDKNIKNAYDYRNTALRPVIRNKDLFNYAIVNKKINKDEDEVFEFGEYPQDIASQNIQALLNTEFSKLNKKFGGSKLKETGKVFNIPFNKKINSYEGKIENIEYKEYILNNKKYIRYMNYGDKKNGYPNIEIWIEVIPIEWLMDYKTQILVSKNSLVSNIYNPTPFYDLMEYESDVAGKDVYDYLDNHFIKDIIPSKIKNSKFKKIFNKEKEMTDPDLLEKINKEMELNREKDRTYNELLASLKSVKESSEKLAKLSGDFEIKSMYHQMKVPRDILLKEVEDHYEINRDFIPLLKYIDLSELSVLERKIKATNIDFSDTNIILNPQRIYNKDLSGSILDEKNVLKNFDGVNIKGADVSRVKKAFNLENAIIDEKTKLPIEDEKINRL